MNWYLLLFLFVLNVCLLEGNRRNQYMNRIINLLKRRHAGHRTILKTPRYPKHLPPSERLLPGHTLIRPAVQMLKSSIKYPLRESDSMLVYGNLNNLGITYGRTPHRVEYSGFRRSNNIVEMTIAQAVRNIIKSNPRQSDTNVIFLEALNTGEESSLGSLRPELEVLYTTGSNNGLDDAREIFSDSSAEDEVGRTRRHFYRKKKRQQYRNRQELEQSSNETELSSSESSDTSGSSDFDTNHGNPFSLYKGKYKQNWMWNHFMDGDHMNINPFGPTFGHLGPSGADLMFGRKWWYFHQDDYKPMR